MTLTIPTATVDRVAKQLVTSGRIARGYLGLGMQQVRIPDTLKQSLNLTESRGLIVVSVEPNGPAEQAGVLVGDIVIGLDGRSVTDTSDVQAVLGGDSVGKSITARVIRGGTPQEISLTVAERPRREA
jgi:S1-C subfamily serine protease